MTRRTRSSRSSPRHGPRSSCGSRTTPRRACAGRSSTFSEGTVTLDVAASVEIARPPEAVAAYEFEPTNDPSWIGGVKTAERLTDGPIVVGSRVRRRGSFLGRPIEWVMDVAELVPARRLAMHAVRSPFPMDVTYELEPAR